MTGNAFDVQVSYAHSQGVGYNIKTAYLQMMVHMWQMAIGQEQILNK